MRRFQMGRGYNYKCKKCRKDYQLRLGAGWSLPDIYVETVEAIRQGAFGEEYRRLFDSEAFICVDVEKDLFICRSCGRWRAEASMNLYEPNDPEAVSQEMEGDELGKKLGYDPYMTRFVLERDYHLKKRRIHMCECGKRMHRASGKELELLACPRCRTMNPVKEYLMWD